MVAGDGWPSRLSRSRWEGKRGGEDGVLGIIGGAEMAFLFLLVW